LAFLVTELAPRLFLDHPRPATKLSPKNCEFLVVEFFVVYCG
jgi:hypothetical protein